MNTLAVIANWSVFAFALLLWVVQMLAHEAGYWVGSRRRAREGEVQAEGVGVVVGGMLSLLAFVLALTLSFANSRFSERVEGTLNEAMPLVPRGCGRRRSVTCAAPRWPGCWRNTLS